MAAAGSTQALVQLLQDAAASSRFGSKVVAIQQAAANCLAHAMTGSSANCAVLATAAGIEPLVQLSSSNVKVQRKAVYALYHAVTNLDGNNKVAVTEAAEGAAIPQLVQLLDSSSNADVQYWAAHILQELADEHAAATRRTIIADAGGVQIIQLTTSLY